MNIPSALPHSRARGFLGHAIMAAAMDVEADREADFNAWYSHEHLHERVAIPGFNRGTRWIRRSEEAAETRKYLTIYETDDVAVFNSPPYLKALDSPTPWTTEIVPAFIGTSRTVSKVLGSAGPAVGNVVQVLEFPAVEDEGLAAWFWDHFVPHALVRPNLCGAHICAPDLQATRAKDQTAESRAFKEPDQMTGYTLIVYFLDGDGSLGEVLDGCPNVPFDPSASRLSTYSFLSSLLSTDFYDGR